GLTDKKVIGNVARFTFQKNQHLLVEIFEELYKKDSSYRLMLVGDGENFEEIKNMVESKGLNDVVLFLGCRDDVPELLNTMDIFVLTSRFEGLPLSLVEAQANGLYCVVSSNTTKEINVTGRISYVNDDNNTDEWKTLISNFISENHIMNTDVLKNCGFDIVTEANKLSEEYFKIVKNKNAK
ncbi:MAG: glycosyltransferase, partial [Clostridia bacterium]|nr:glycosyltransferase [Clostridia bacterium]